MPRLIFVSVLLLTCWGSLHAQNAYRYSVDLRNISNDQLHIELVPPKITSAEITFHMPKIIPGTYNVADYGRFVHNFMVVDKAGKPLPVRKLDTNSWQIRNATSIGKISYDVEDTWESEIPHEVYDMSGTNIEAGKNIVLNTPGFFGYIGGMNKLPFELTITRPESFYGSTPLIATKSDATTDVFQLEDADHLYDSPLMYSKPDTTTIQVASTRVLVSVYAPRKMITSAAIATLLKDVLLATRDYLGGKLPVNKYAFIFYFNSEQQPLKNTGALEHNYSSFYALPEVPFDNIAPILSDISAHEFFHIVTPLTISSKEVKHFNFNEPVMSKHLWLYEGSTEYAAHHVQVTQNLISADEFLSRLTEKIKESKNSFNDELPFTELSKHSADRHNSQYLNVYQKGALISACLDLYLLKLSGGQYGMRDLMHDLSVRYGRDKYFNDDELFDEITRLTYPEVREFFRNYVEGPNMIPYEKYFAYAGVSYNSRPASSLGRISMGGGSDGRYKIVSTENMNAFGRSMGYQVGDELLTINGESITLENGQKAIPEFLSTLKQGDLVEVKVLRTTPSGEKKEMTLSSHAILTPNYSLEFAARPDAEQLKIRNAWLGISETDQSKEVFEAAPADVASVDAVITTLYGVISGPAGERDWKRFQSLFYPGTKMGAVIQDPQGDKQLKRLSPGEYAAMNAPYFKQFDFIEKELQRKTNTYGNVSQVFSSYEYTLKMAQQTVTQRGVNSIHLVNEQGRWWITSFTWNEETPDNPLPAELTGAVAPAPVQPKKKKK